MSQAAEDSRPPTNVEIVTFALGELDDGGRPVHLERIAARAFVLIPGAFRWDLDEFSGQIDKDKVRVSLVDAARDKHGGTVEAVGPKKQGISKPADAWKLTPAGAAWYRENKDRVATALGTSKPALKRGRAVELRKRLLGSELYGEYREKREVSSNAFAFADLLECSPDASNRVVQDKFDALAAQVQLLDDQPLMAFLEACAEVHTDMLLATRRDQ